MLSLKLEKVHFMSRNTVNYCAIFILDGKRIGVIHL